MAVYPIGGLIRQLRRQQNITQQTLAYAAETDRSLIAKIESGKSMPTAYTLEKILKYLGYEPDKILDRFLGQEDTEIQRLKNELEAHLFHRRISEADKLIKQLEMNELFSNDNFQKQFLLKCKANNAIRKKEEWGKIREMLTDAIKLTIPLYKEDDVGEYLLSRQGIELVNMTAISYFEESRLEQAIDIMYKLKKSCEKFRFDAASRSTELILIITNLTKYLGIAGRHKEVVELCDYGKRLCLDSGSLILLPKIIYNKAHALHALGDKEPCERLVKQAYYACDLFELYIEKEIIHNGAASKFGVIL